MDVTLPAENTAPAGDQQPPARPAPRSRRRAEPCPRPEDFGIGRLFWTICEAVVVAEVESGRIVLWNPAAEALFGYSAAEAVGMSVEILVPRQLRVQHRAALAHFHATGHGPIVDSRTARELPALRRDGEELTTEVTLVGIDEAAVPGQFVIAIIRDVSERKRAEEERIRRIREEAAHAEAEAAGRRFELLAEASQRLASSLDEEAALASLTRLAVDALADWCAVDVVQDDGTIRRIAASHADPGREPLVRELRHPRLAESGASTRLLQVLRTGQSVLVAGGAGLATPPLDDPEHAAALRALGLASYMIVPLAARSRTFGAITLASASPERRYGPADLALAEELGRRAALAIDNARLHHQVQTAETRYRRLFEGMADATLVASPDTRILDANQAAVDLTGYTLAELRRLRVGDLVVGGLELVREQLLGSRRTGQWRTELEIRRKDGAYVPVEAWATLIDLPDGTVYVGCLRDISERRAMERAHHEFLAVVSHELRNPLTSIKAYAQLMQMRGAYSERAVESIIAQTSRTDRLIDDLLDISRLEAGRLQLKPRRVDLVSMATAAVEQAREQARTLDKGHTIRVEAPTGPLKGWWDHDRLEQVLQNLLGNALKYSPRGGEVVVRVADLGAEAQVSVSDQGVGIPPEVLGRLFQRFSRAPSGEASKIKGLGLGLYICRALVQAHGGRIWAESEGEGKGSTFAFILPYSGPPG